MTDRPKGKSSEPQGGAAFVRDIVKDPANVPDVMRLYGYLGASSEKGHERLYLSPDLSFYVEIPADAVLHRMAVPADQDPYDASMLWVRRDAQLKEKATPAANALAHYFAGVMQGAAGSPQPPIQYLGHNGQNYAQGTGLVICATPNHAICPVTQYLTAPLRCRYWPSPAIAFVTPYIHPYIGVTQIECATPPVVCWSNFCNSIPNCNTGQQFACATPRC